MRTAFGDVIFEAEMEAGAERMSGFEASDAAALPAAVVACAEATRLSMPPGRRLPASNLL